MNVGQANPGRRVYLLLNINAVLLGDELRGSHWSWIALQWHVYENNDPRQV